MLSTEEIRRLDRLSIRTASSASPSAAATLRQAAAAGHGLDFHDFRRYQPGDDPRRIDWTIAARHRQLVVRQFRAEGHVRVHLLVDVSRSMTLGRPSKLESSAKIAAALGYATVRELGLREGVRLGNVAGAYVAQRVPCSEAMPTLDELSTVSV